MKKKVFILLVGILGFIAVPTLNSSSQTLKDYAAVAKLSYDIVKDIDADCKEKQKAGVLKVCKNDGCPPGNCISFRKRCLTPDDCK
ncbi:MAG: hypothetical protein ACXIUD_07825 [Mongoliitalea sp.]